MKKHVGTRVIPIPCSKVALVERLTKATNNNAVVAFPEKIVALLTVPESRSSASVNVTRSMKQGKDMRSETVCVPLKLDEISTISA